MRIAVTGATGFLGGVLVPALRGHRHEVVALDRNTTGDIAAVADWSAALAGAEAVVHLAALAHARGIDQARLHAVNVAASIAIGEAAAAAGMRMVFMSSAKVFGEETRGAAFDERSPVAPQDAYGRAKLAAEEGLRAIAGLQLTVLRPPLVYGPGVGANFLALMRAVARGWPLPLASIGNRRSLVGAANLADAVNRCLAAPQAVGRSFCVTDGAPLSTPALCRAIGAALQRDARLFAFPPALLELAPPARKLTRSLVLDDQAMRRDLGWTPPHSFEAGLRRTAEWFLAQGG
jgi:nucleoside-diphosphate-sugar epimerase